MSDPRATPAVAVCAVRETAPGEQRVALVHELAHALADQQHPLGKYLKKGTPDDDGSTAREAVMEGQATWLTWAYVSKRNGGKAEVSKEMIDSASSSVTPLSSMRTCLGV